jgi:hypothetical protein
MFALLGLLSWNAYTTFEISKAMAATQVTLANSKERDTAQDIALEGLRVRITALEIRFAESKH